MYKKILIPSILSSLFLFGCSDSDSAKLEIRNADEQLAFIENNFNENDDFSLDSAYLVDFTSNKEDEILVLSNNSEITKVEIFSFDKKTKEWDTLFLDESHNNFDGLENLSLIKILKTDANEQIVLGHEGGAYNTLNFKVLSYDEEKNNVDIILDKMFNEYTDAIVLFENNEDLSPSISIEKDESILEYFKWDDSSLKYEKLEK